MAGRLRNRLEKEINLRLSRKLTKLEHFFLIHYITQIEEKKEMNEKRKEKRKHIFLIIYHDSNNHFRN